MPKETVYDGDGMNIYYYPDKKILIQETYKFTRTEVRREALEEGYNIIVRDRVSKWITNNKSGSAIPKEDVEYGINFWFPRSVKAGLKYWAVILPEQAVGKISGKKMVDELSKSGVTVETFQNESDAVAWLDSL